MSFTVLETPAGENKCYETTVHYKLLVSDNASSRNFSPNFAHFYSVVVGKLSVCRNTKHPNISRYRNVAVFLRAVSPSIILMQ